MTKEERESFLKEIYNFQINNANSNIKVNKKDNHLYRNELEFIEYWEAKGCIRKISQSIGSVIFKVTPYGIDYVERELIDK